MEPDRKKPAATPRRPAAFASLACVAAAVLCGASASAGERPDETDYLFRVSLPANAVDVFLPAREIGTREEAAAYLDWARRTHVGSKGEIRAVWDDEPVDVSLPKNSNLRTNLLAFVRDGDSAVDPSGFNAFTVTNADAATGAFQLVLVGGLAPNGTRATIDPRVCLTNVWVLPRRELFARWDREAPTNAAGVRAEIAALRDSGLFRLSVGRGKAWEAAVDAYVRGNRDLRPKIRFWNRSGVPVLLSFDGGPAEPIGSGRSFEPDLSVADDRTSFPWRARRADLDSATDADYKWEEGDIDWNASSTEDVAKTFFAPPGTLKPKPHFVLPRGAVPRGLDAAQVRAFVRYAGQNEAEVELMQSGGSLLLSAVPHRRLESLRLSGPEGWKDGSLFPESSANLAYGETGVLILKTPMQPPPVQWQSVVFTNGFANEVEFSIMRDKKVIFTTNIFGKASIPLKFDPEYPSREATDLFVSCLAQSDKGKAPWKQELTICRGTDRKIVNIQLDYKGSQFRNGEIPAAKPSSRASETILPSSEKHVWPTEQDVDRLKKYLEGDPFKVVMTEGSRPGDKVAKAKETLSDWQAFWMNAQPARDVETIFRAVVAHIASCPKGCSSCRTARMRPDLNKENLLPKEEAFLVLGSWDVDKQRRFCRECAEKNGWKYDWDDFEDDRQGWIDFVSKQADRPGEKATENLKAFWTGENENGKAFANLYRSVERGTLPDRRFDGILLLPTFEDRRRELFRIVMTSGPDHKSDAEVKGWTQKLDQCAGVTQ